MIANYHTHTYRCKHAGQYADREYVEAALAAGMQTLGFADHTPQFFSGSYYSGFRMRPEEIPGYTNSIEVLKQEYDGRIELLTGLEVEYYPMHFPRLLTYLREFPIDYMILGQHFVKNEYDAPEGGICTGNRDVVRHYCAQCMEAMETGLFSYFAHPDNMVYYGDEGFYRESIRPMCRRARELEIPLEMNLEGVRKGKHYPNPVFWKVAAEEGCQVILGADAHAPGQIHTPDAENKALKMAHKYGLTVLDRVKLRSINR